MRKKRGLESGNGEFITKKKKEGVWQKEGVKIV